MPSYTMRQTSRRNDFIVCIDGIDAGRCYLRRLAGNRENWWWTIYVGAAPVKRRVDGVALAGDGISLKEATDRFKRSFERLIEAGAVVLPPEGERA